MAEEIDPTRAALLAAMAKSGSAAQAASAPADQLGAAQAAAQSAATERADQIQAPGGFYGQQAAQIAEPYQTAGRDSAAARAAQGAYTGGLSSLTKDYSTRVQQALPVLNSVLASQVQQKAIDDPFKQQQQQWAIEDRQYQTQQRQLEQKAQDDYNRQQKLIQDINTNPGLSQDARDTFNQIISSAGDDYASALQIYGATLSAQSKDKKKQAEVQSILPFLSQYFGVAGGGASKAAKAAAQKAPAKQADKKPSPSVLSQINSSINPFSGGFKGGLSGGLRGVG